MQTTLGQNAKRFVKQPKKTFLFALFLCCWGFCSPNKLCRHGG